MFNKEQLEGRLKDHADAIVDFDYTNEKLYEGQKTADGVNFLSFRMSFREHEIEELKLRWEQWIRALKITSRDSCLEGRTTSVLSDKPKLKMEWRKHPEVLDWPEYPGQYMLKARLMVSKRP